jgi:TonB-linked SusC/RagA family outer membrane protein
MKKILMILVLTLSSVILALGQTVQIRGTVTSSEDGLGIPGVTINVKGTTVGVITDENGNYSLNVPQGSNVLVFSFIGMKKQEVDITGKGIVNIIMEPDTQTISEVVVVAYGTASKESITGAVAAINSTKIENRSLSSVTSILEGAATGIQVNNTYGEPGSDPSIRIRGFASINGSNVPLYVVDGVAYSGKISDLNPQDIESLTVLKDAASAALYGSRASNGVVIITTKSGKGSGKLNINANVNLGVYNRGIEEYERMGPDEWMETEWTGYKNFAVSSLGYNEADAAAYSTTHVVPDIIKSNIYNKGDVELFTSDGKLVSDAQVLEGYDDLNWNDYLQRVGNRQEYSLSAEASTDTYNFYSSIGYLNEQGYLKTADYQRYTGRINANYTPNKWFKSGFNIGGSNSESNYTGQATGGYFINPFYNTRNLAPVFPVFLHNADGSYLLDDEGNKQYDLSSSYLSSRHIVYELENNLDINNRTSLKGQAYATITFLKDFQFTFTGDKNLVFDSKKNYNNPEVGDGAGSNGRLYYTVYRYSTNTLQQQLFWSKSFNDHHFDVLVAHESFAYNYSYNYSAITGIKVTGIIENSNFSNMTSMDGYSVDHKIESYLSRARYNYREKYFFDASFRTDGSSRFYSENRWGNFFSLGGTWAITSEDFMDNIEWVSFLKLRASYGEVGNDSGTGNYGYMALYSIDQNGNDGAFYQSNLANPDLKWETTATADIALEGRLFDRLNFTIDIFDKRSRDLLFEVALPLSVGATESNQNGAKIMRNIGSISNRGLELAFDADIIRKGSFKWNLGINATLLKNEILSLPEGEDIPDDPYKYSEGHSIYEFWTYKSAGVDQMTGDALLKINYEDYCVVQEGTEDTRGIIPNQWLREINSEYYTVNATYGLRDWSGSALPKVYGSISNDLTYKNFYLSGIITYSLGGKVYDASYQSLMSVGTSPSAIHVDLANAWNGVPSGMTETSENRIDPDGIPRVDMYYSTYFNSMRDRWLQDASYLVVKNISIGYNLPRKYTERMNLGGLALRMSVENLATFTAIKGMNPQYNFSGGSNDTYVTARVFSFGIDIKL